MTDKAAALSSAAATQPSPRRPSRANDDAPQFSYALASAGLERQAAQSLKAHGATGNTGTPSARASGSPHANSNAAPESGRPASQPTKDSATSRPADEASQDVASQPRDAGAAQAVPSASIAANSGNAPSATSAPAQAPQTRAVESAGAREGSTSAQTKADAAKALRQPQQSAKTTETFAEIIARRLEKSSSFDLRLDPPGLGRVDGRLLVHDDGKAVLHLSFDREAAYDFYSNNSEALRQALTQAGLDFGSGGFSFNFEERAGEALNPEISNFNEAAAIPAPPAPLLAPAHARALDIRV